MEVKFVPKGWGWEKWLANSELYCGKLLYVVQGKRCSVHFHKLKDETFYVHKGELTLYHTTLNGLPFAPDEDPTVHADWWNKAWHQIVSKYVARRTLQAGDTFHVPPLMFHQFRARFDTELFEFSTQHFDEDSYRVIKGD